jgi:protein translocase SecG subunit
MDLPLLSKILQIVFSVLLTFLVLIQSKNAGLAQGLKGSFGAYRSLRGVERVVFIATIVLGVLLVANSIFLLVL